MRARLLNYAVIAVLLAVPTVFGVISIKRGQDINWDVLNYHLYNPYAFLNNRIGYDLAPAGLQTYFNPAIDTLYYKAFTSVNPKLLAFLLGFIQGLNFVLLFGVCRQTLKWLKINRAIAISIALTGVCSVGFLSEIGTVFHDSLTALFSLSSLFLIMAFVIEKSFEKRTLVVTLLAGLVSGLGTGLKLTTIIFTAALCLSLFFLPISWSKKLMLSAIFAAGTAIGFFCSGGYWMYSMWHNFGNPLFPQYNQIFQGPLALNDSVRDIRFIPKSLFEAVFYPIIFTVEPGRVSEIQYKQISWVIAYIGLVIFWVTALLKFLRRKLYIAAQSRYLIAYFSIAYIAWLQMFGIYRYTIAIEMLIPLLLFVIVAEVVRSKTAGIWTLLLIGIITVVNFRGAAEWGHAGWTRENFHIDNKEWNDLKPSVIFLGGQPLAWIVPVLDPEEPVVQLAPNFPVSKDYWNRAEKILSSRQGQPYLIYDPDDTAIAPSTAAGLEVIGLRIDSDSCAPFGIYIFSKKFDYRYCKVVPALKPQLPESP